MSSSFCSRTARKLSELLHNQLLNHSFSHFCELFLSKEHWLLNMVFYFYCMLNFNFDRKIMVCHMDIFCIVISFHHFVTIDIWQKMVNKLNFKLMTQPKWQKKIFLDLRFKIDICWLIRLFYMLFKT